MIELLDYQLVREGKEGDFRLGPLNLRLDQGKHYALLGPNGCGKTSLALALLGGLAPRSGRLRLCGTELGPLPHQRTQLGAVFKESLLFSGLSVLENIEFSRKLTPAISELLELFKLRPLLHQSAARLSSGEQTRVALLRALAAQPRLLILDEALDAIEAAERARIAEALRSFARREQMTLLLVTHDPREAHLHAEELILLGRAADGSFCVEAEGEKERLLHAPPSENSARLLMTPTRFRRSSEEGYVACYDAPQPDAGFLRQVRLHQGGEGEFCAYLGPSARNMASLFSYRGGVVEVAGVVLEHLSIRGELGGYLDLSCAELSPALDPDRD